MFEETGDQLTSRYYVWCCPGGSMGYNVYDSYHKAVEKAKALAEGNKGHEFLVLRTICGVTYKTDPFAMRRFAKS